MESSSSDFNQSFFMATVKNFPPVIEGKINVIQFLEAANNLLSVVERFGKVFAPVVYDMQGNIAKIKQYYVFDENSCLLELMLHETANSSPVAAEGILWLNRALLFFEILFQEVLSCFTLNKTDENMTKIFTVAYEGSVKKYHSWVTQRIFSLICRMSPTMPQMMKSLEVENNLKAFEERLTSFNVTLHLVRCKIDDFFKANNLFEEAK